MSHKDFDAALKELQGQSITFNLGGKRFTVPLPLPAAPFAEFVSDENAQLVPALRDYMKAIIKPTQQKMFDKAFVDSRIDEKTLIELVDWVMTEATGFPSKRREQSSRQSRRSSRSAKPDSPRSAQKAASSA